MCVKREMRDIPVLLDNLSLLVHLCISIYLTVKEANDACLWLKAAGFPQYVQMFEGESSAVNISCLCCEQKINLQAPCLVASQQLVFFGITISLCFQ